MVNFWTKRCVENTGGNGRSTRDGATEQRTQVSVAMDSKVETLSLCDTRGFVTFQVFLCGSHPHWLFMSPRGALRIHPQNIDGKVTCFAPFHNVNCPKGFLYFNNQVWTFRLRIKLTPHRVTKSKFDTSFVSSLSEATTFAFVFRVNCASRCFRRTCRMTSRGRCARCRSDARRTKSLTTRRARCVVCLFPPGVSSVASLCTDCGR